MDRKEETIRHNVLRLMESQFEKQLEVGINVEKEHKDLYDLFERYLEAHGVPMPLSETEMFRMIALAHIRELDNYYDLLKKMESSVEVK